MSGTPVIFNVAYTPYKLKKGSTEEEKKPMLKSARITILRAIRIISGI